MLLLCSTIGRGALIWIIWASHQLLEAVSAETYHGRSKGRFFTLLSSKVILVTLSVYRSIIYIDRWIDVSKWDTEFSNRNLGIFLCLSHLSPYGWMDGWMDGCSDVVM